MAPGLAYFRPLNHALVALLAASAGFSSLTSALPPFAATQGIASAAALGLAVLTIAFRPFRGIEVWKTHISSALLLLTACTGVFSVVMLWLSQGGSVARGTATSLSLALLTFAFAVVLLLFFSWWRALRKQDPQWKAKCAAALKARRDAVGALKTRASASSRYFLSAAGAAAGAVTAGAAEAASAATPAPPSFFQQRIIKLPDWAKELLGLDEDVDVEARDGAAAALAGDSPPLVSLPPPQSSSSSAAGSQGESLTHIVHNPLLLHAASAPLPPPTATGEEENAQVLRAEGMEFYLWGGVALVPGWRPGSAPGGEAAFVEVGGERWCREAPYLDGLPEGVDPFEYFECVEGERYYWSDGRRGEKGRRDGRLMAPGWRRCVRGGATAFVHVASGKVARRPVFLG